MRKYKLNAKIFSILVALCLLLSGCGTSEKKLKDMAFPQGIGIDYKNESYSVSMMIYDTSKTSGSSSQLSGNLTRVYSDYGESIAKAINNTTLVIGKKPFFSHNRVVIIGTEMAASGIDEVMDVIYRDPEIRPYVFLIVARGSAYDILNATFGDALNPAEEIQNIITTGSYYSNVAEMDIVHAAACSYENTSDIYMPIVELDKEGEDKFVKASGTAIFNNLVLVGELNENETKGLIWINGLTEYGTLVTETSSGIVVSAEVVDADTDVKVHIENGEIIYSISVVCSLNIVQSNGNELEKNSSENINDIEDAYVKLIGEQIDGALNKCLTEYKSDVFRLGKRLWQAEPEIYMTVCEDWREHLDELKFDVNVKASVSRSGEEIMNY